MTNNSIDFYIIIYTVAHTRTNTRTHTHTSARAHAHTRTHTHTNIVRLCAHVQVNFPSLLHEVI